MRKAIILGAVALFTICAAAFSGESANVEVYKFKFGGQNGVVDLELNSDTMGFGLHDLQPGDSRTTVTEDGTAITIARLAEVYTLDVDGEVFEIPARHGPMHGGAREMHIAKMGGPEDSRHMAIAHGMGDGLTILSREPLDETRQATIRAALNAAGIVDELEFLSPGLSTFSDEDMIDDDGQHRMIIKRVISEQD